MTSGNIYLIGYMGVGKTYLGRALAQKMSYNFFDLDEALEEKCQMSIKEIFQTFGSGKFREIEASLLQVERSNTVVATGGGAPVYYNNIEWMKNDGLVIYLKLSVETIIERLKNEQDKRPLIASKHEDQLRKYVHENMSKRAPIYEQAHLVHDPTKNDIQNLSDHIKKTPGFGVSST